MMESQLQLAKTYFEQGDLTQSREMLDLFIKEHQANADALLLRGLIHYRMQRWGDAINDFCSVLEINPEHPEAKMRLEMTQNILSFFTPDMFNP